MWRSLNPAATRLHKNLHRLYNLGIPIGFVFPFKLYMPGFPCRFALDSLNRCTDLSSKGSDFAKNQSISIYVSIF